METHNQVKRLELADYTVRSSAEKLDRSGWVNYGVDNLFPQYLRELAQTGAVHGSLCVSIGEMIAGKGLDAGAYNKRLEELKAYDVFYGCSNDLKLYGGFYLEVIYTVDRENVAKMRHLPFEECRLAVTGEEEEICGVYHSNDWGNTRKKRNKPEFIPIYNVMSKGEEPRQVYYCFNYAGSNFYPRPDYYSAINSIELAKEISVYHVNNIMNGLSPSMIVSLFQGAPAPDEQQQIKTDWERQLTGARNAGKFIMTFNERDTPRPEITTFPLSDADKQYEFLSRESTSLIMVAHRVVTPLIFGIRDTGGGFGSNKDEMAVGLEIFTNQVIQPAQNKIAKSFEEVLGFEMPGLTITVIPNSPLTQAEQIAVTPQIGEPTEAPIDSAADVAGTALNGAQIGSMVEILIQAATGVLPVESAKGVMRASFPILTDAQINEIFSGIVAGSVNPNEVALGAFQTFLSHVNGEKKKVCCESHAEEVSGSVADELISLGEDAPEGYILIDSYEVDYDNDDAENEELIKIEAHELASTGSAKPMKPSDQDETNYAGVTFMTRYRYAGSKSPEREFCKKMMAADKLYRKEDIEAMEFKAVNPHWGPNGSNFYSIWLSKSCQLSNNQQVNLYKGGGNCYHFWQKEVYINAKGINPLANDSQKIAVAKAEKMGYKVRNDIRVSLLPIDQDYNGFLPTNPVYGKDGKNYRR
jgi:hypothetical protein